MGVLPDKTKLQKSLAQLLRITDTELTKRLKEVGQELAFYFAINPELSKQFVTVLNSEQPQPNQLKTKSFTESSNPTNMEQVREMLLSHNVSDVLKKKL